MKQTPEEKRKRENFLPGKITRDGFLGEDERHIHDIIEDDARRLASMGLTVQGVAETLQRFIQLGKEGLESPVEDQNHIIEVQWQRGALPCPFGEAGLHPKIMATIIDRTTQRKLRFSQLSVHLIRKHGFFGGKGSPFRLDPEDLKQFV